ncbi:hypothetical protein GGER_28050 [Serratia rubidaea]
MLTDASKFGQIQPNPLATPQQISRVITDTRLPPDYQQLLQRQGLQLDMVGE